MAADAIHRLVSCFTVGALLAACTLDASTIRKVEQLRCASETCLMDPHAHCISMSGCRNSSECPGGTRCEAPQSSDSRDVSKMATSCRAVQLAQEGSTALTNGFQARELGLQKDSAEGEPAVFSAALPIDSVAVYCAVFGCLPEFADSGSVDGASRYSMVNFDQCVLGLTVRGADETSQGARFHFEVENATRYVPANHETCPAQQFLETRVPSASPFNFVTTKDPPVVSELSAGCWVLDATRVTYATRLEPLRFDEAAQMMTVLPCAASPRADDGGPLAEECSTEPVSLLGVDQCADGRSTDGLNCFPTALGAFGTCRESECLPRCLDGGDCSSIGHGCCERRSDRLVGVCRPTCATAGAPP